MKRRIVMAMLAAMMVVSNVTPVLAEPVIAGDTNLNGGDLTATTDTKDAIYKISVPKNMTMYLDPYQLAVDNTDNYIVSDDFTITNKSNIAVQVNAKVTVTPGGDVTVKDTAEEVTETDSTKLIYVEAQIPTDITEKKENGAAYYDTDDWETELSLYKKDEKYYSSNVASSSAVTDEMVDVTSAKGDYTTKTPVSASVTAADGVTLPFLLAGAEYINYYENDTATDIEGSAFKTVAEDGKSTAAFRLSGKLNTEATWGDSDITAKVEYTLIGLAKGKYDEKAALIQVDGGHAYIGDAAEEPEETTVFTSTTAGQLAFASGAVTAINKIEVEVSGTTYDVFNKNGKTWTAGTFNATTAEISAKALTFLTTNIPSDETVNATVTYTDAESAEQTKVVQLKIR